MDKLIEVCRSYSRKIKAEKQYEMIDVLCSLKQEVSEAEIDETAKKLQALAEQFVERDIARLEDERDNKQAKIVEKKDRAREEAELTVHELL